MKQLITTRRQHLQQILRHAGALGLLTTFGANVSAAVKNQVSLGLGFSLYGMRSLPLDRAVAACATIGYDCVELPVNKGWPADSATFNARRQAAFRKTLDDHQIRLSALMENLPIFGDDAAHRNNLDRLKGAANVAHGVTGDPRPIVETILGGKPSQWKDVKDQMRLRLEDWARVAEKEKMIIAIKAHVGGAMHLPEHPASLVTALDHPSIRAAYDFSHFRLREVDMEASVKQLAHQSVFVHVKDAKGSASKVQFLLPGEGDIDYKHLLTLLVDNGYRGDIVVEVSGQIHGKRGYDPLDAARRSFKPLAEAMKRAGLSRR